MAFPNPHIELTIGNNQLINGIRQSRKEFEELQRGAGRSFDSMNAGANQASGSLTKVREATEKTKLSVQSLTLSMVGLGTSVVGVVTSFSNIERNAARVEKALIAVQRIENQIATLRVREEKLMARGKQDTNEFAVNQQKLATAYDELKVKQQDVLLAQDALRDSQVLLGTTIVNTAVNSGILLTTIIQSARASQVDTAAKFVQTGAVANLGKASLFSAAGVRSLTAASLAFAATPFGIALIAIGGALLVMETNLFGARHALEDFIGVQRDSLTISKAMDDTFKMMGGSTKDYDQSIGVATGTTGEFYTTVGGGIDTLGGMSSGISGISFAAMDASTSLDSLIKRIAELNAIDITLGGSGLGQFATLQTQDLEQYNKKLKEGVLIQELRQDFEKQMSIIGETEKETQKAILTVYAAQVDVLDKQRTLGQITNDMYNERLNILRKIKREQEIILAIERAQERSADRKKNDNKLSPLNDLIASIFAILPLGNQAHYAEYLLSLSDETLKDMGIKRSELRDAIKTSRVMKGGLKQDPYSMISSIYGSMAAARFFSNSGGKFTEELWFDPVSGKYRTSLVPRFGGNVSSLGSRGKRTAFGRMMSGELEMRINESFGVMQSVFGDEILDASFPFVGIGNIVTSSRGKNRNPATLQQAQLLSTLSGPASLARGVLMIQQQASLFGISLPPIPRYHHEQQMSRIFFGPSRSETTRRFMESVANWEKDALSRLDAEINRYAIPQQITKTQVLDIAMNPQRGLQELEARNFFINRENLAVITT